MGLQEARAALKASGYDAVEYSSGDGIYIAGIAPDSSEYEGGTEPGGEWDRECEEILEAVASIVEQHGCTAAWDDDDIHIEERAALVDSDGDCLECGHPANNRSGHGTCDSLAHRIYGE